MKTRAFRPVLNGAFLLAFTATKAQTLTNGALTPLPGESYSHWCMYYDGVPPAGGIGQQWSLTIGACGFPLNPYVWTNAEAEDENNAPGCDRIRSMVGHREYWQGDAQGFRLLKTFDGAPQMAFDSLADPMDIIHYPLAFGESFTDTYGGTHRYSSEPVFAVSTITGSITVTVDGQGSLATTYATYPDAIRLHVTTEDDKGLGDVEYTDEYWFVVAGYHMPVVKLRSAWSSLAPDPLHIGFMLYDAVTALPETGHNTLPSIWTNEGRLCVDLPTMTGYEQYEIIGTDGRLLSQGRVAVRHGRFEAPLPGGHSGIVLLKLFGSKGDVMVLRGVAF